jgi:dihydrolipoamide dehydrogenase
MSKRITIIGAGPGGYVAAIRAAQLNNEVILIEKDELGGTCLNRGCIPTKSLMQSADLYWEAKNSGIFGVNVGQITLDFSAAIKRKDKVVKQLVNGVQYLMRKNRVKVIRGVGTLIDPKTIKVAESNEEVESDSIIIATGSIPSSIPIEGIKGEGVIDSTEALQMQQLPASIAIIGGGVIGIEFAQMMQRMGVKVTIIEMMPQILPTEDADIVQLLGSALKKEGVEIFTGSTLNKIESAGKSKKILFTTKEGNKERIVDKVLVAVGRSPETTNLGLEKLGIGTERNFIRVDGKMETNVPGVYAIGDAVGGIMLAHLASHQGRCAVENASGFNSKIDYRAVPRCIYTTPELGCVGLTELQAREKYGSDVMIGKFPLAGNGKAMILEGTSGMVKIIAEKSCGEVLGVEMVGPNATELIAEATLGMHMEATFEEFASAIHAHPTISEAIMEAALNVKGQAIHV